MSYHKLNVTMSYPPKFPHDQSQLPRHQVIRYDIKAI